MCSLRNESPRVSARPFASNAPRPRNSGAAPKLRQAANQRNRAPAGRGGELFLGEGKQYNIWRNAMDIKQGRMAGERHASIIRLRVIAGTDGLPGVSVGSPVARGYAVSTTDTGHQAGGTDARWALNADGSPATAKIADYYYRAVHQVAVTSKALVKAFYGAGSISRSYFAGCSNGGRQAYNQATKFPDDFDRIISRAPVLDIRALRAG